MRDKNEKLLSEWWIGWFIRDFSWKGLEAYTVRDPTIINVSDHSRDLEKDNVRGVTLQDYWRFVTSKVTRSDGALLSDEQLVEIGALIPDNMGILWHRGHFPLQYQDGSPTDKFYWPALQKNKLIEEIRFALSYSRETTWDPSSGNLVGGDGRARLDGTVLLEFPAEISFPISVRMPFAYIESPFIVSDKLIGSGSNFDDMCLSLANFSGSRFGKVSQKGYISFDRTLFLNQVNFDDCKFESEVQFIDTNFLDNASFEAAVFKHDCRFTAAQFNGFCEFDRSRFEGDAWFTNANWEVGFGVSFTRVTFRGLPAFYGARFHNNTSFWDAEFSVVSDYMARSRYYSKWVAGPLGLSLFTFWVSFVVFVSFPYPPLFTLLAVTLYAGLTSSIFFLQLFAFTAYLGLRHVDEWQVESLIRAFAMLSHVSNESKNKNDALVFKRLQNQMTRLTKGLSLGDRLISRPVEKVLSYLYDICSGYGTSLIRPLISLTFVLVGCAAVYCSVEEGGYKASRLMSGAKGAGWDAVATSYNMAGAMNYSLSRIFPLGEWHEDVDREGCTFSSRLFLEKSAISQKICVPYDVYIDQKADRPRRILAANLFGVIESVVTTVLIFLFALALRRRFQLD